MKYWAIVAVCIPCLCVDAADVKVIRVADYGAISNDGLDDTPAVQAALKACAGAPSRLVFGPGQYDFYPDRAPERYLFVSNNDEGLKRIAFPLGNSESIEIDGQGALFMFRGWITPFALDHAKNITLKNFSMDWTRTFHSEGKILEVNTNGLTVSFSEAFPYAVRNGILVFTDGKKSQEQQTTVKGSELTYPYGSMLEFDAQKRETAYMARDYWVKGGVMAQDLGQHKVRIILPKLTGTVGNILVFGPSHRDCPGIVISDSANVTVNHVNLYHCGGMGVIAQRSRDITVDHVQVTPAPGSGRVVSITADATHFVNCSGKIILSNSLFENQKDDATNVHGIYARMARLLAPDLIEVQLLHPQQQGFDFIVPGGKLELVHGPSLVTYGEAIVKTVERVNKEFTRVTLTQPLPAESIVGDVVASTDGYPETWIHHCVIRNNRARGILLGSRAKMVIEENVFHTPGAAILLEGDGRFWYEQAGVRDLVIRKNTFDNCNFGVWGKATIEVGAGIEKTCRATSRYNRNVVIEDNLFRTFGSGSLVQMYSVDGLTIRSNRVEKTGAYPAKAGANDKRFDIVESDNVSISE
ncbi:MAG: right-handed parallel beta-helix repeat-containing protein [bacterium]